MGFVAVQGLNVVRAISLFYLGPWSTPVFKFAHEYLWQALIMLDVLIVWLLWVRPAQYAYGLPIFLALVLAARGKGRWVRVLGGYVLLLPFQAFSLTMSALMQMVQSAQTDIRLLRIDQWQMEAIIYGYQWGSLVVPTLAPILLWLWMDRSFVSDVLVRGWRASLPTASP